VLALEVAGQRMLMVRHCKEYLLTLVQELCCAKLFPELLFLWLFIFNAVSIEK
jgi:hypothetical protein